MEGDEGQNKGQQSDIWSQDHGSSRGKAELHIFNLSSDLRQILRHLAPARLVPSSCVSAPRNTREAGISSDTI